MVSDPAASIACSERLGEIPIQHFQAALDRFELGTFVSAEPIRFGNFGQNVFLTSTTGKYVFRGAPHDAAQFPKERFFAELLHKHTRTPVPWPFHIDDTQTIFKWAYVIMPCMPGKQFADPEVLKALSADDWLSLATTMGETVAEMQRLTWPMCGKFDSATRTIIPITARYADWFLGKMQWFIGECRKYPRSNAADLEWLTQEMQRYKSALEVPFAANYVMADLNISNLTAEKIGADWKITGLFDLVQSYFGNGEEDLIGLAMLDHPTLLRAYFAAYLKARPARPGFVERMDLYLLCNRLKSWYWLNEIARLPKDVSFRDWFEKDRASLKSALS